MVFYRVQLIADITLGYQHIIVFKSILQDSLTSLQGQVFPHSKGYLICLEPMTVVIHANS